MMKRYNLLATALVAGALLSSQAFAQDSTTTTTTTKVKVPAHVDTKTTTVTKTKHKKEHKETAAEIQMRELKESVKAQQDEIDSLKSQIAAKGDAAASAQQTAADAQAQAAAAAASAAQAQAAAAAASTKVDGVSSSVTDLKTTTTGLTETVVTNQAHVEEEINEPAKLHYKGITITPVAFFALEGVWRQHAVNSDINTPFNTIPLPSANEGHISELNFSGRQSRIGGLFEGDAGAYKLSGYFEADFLSSGTTSNNNQSNSYTLRQRQIWGKAETKGGFAVTGGQMWSLVTEDGKGTDARTEKLPNTIDPQYMVGFSWTRQPGIRVQQRFGDYKTGALTVAMSVENAQITNFAATSATTNAVPTNFYFAGAGQNGGLYNAYNGTYANNVAPDVIVKAAFDAPMIHAELGGLGRFMRDYYYPITGTATSGTPAVTTYTYAGTSVSNTAAAGGVFGSVRVKTSQYADVMLQGMAGTGVGRYGSSQLADATLKPTGALEPIKNYHGEFALETHPTPKLDVYAYGGAEYAQRTVYTITTPGFAGALEGYGAPNLSDKGCYGIPANPGSSTGGSPSAAGCSSPTRMIGEGMIGFTYRVVDSKKFGRLQYQATYSYIQRNLWSGVVTGSYGAAGSAAFGPRATENMFHVGMRYYIP
jgi:hypothetical protein